LNSLYADHEIYIISGPASLIIHKWPNSEAKLLPVWEGIIIQPDDFWLEKYPFLALVPDNEHGYRGNNSEYRYCFNITDNRLFYSHSLDPQYAAENAIVISHNNHFGHFIFDNLPLLNAISPFFHSYSHSFPLAFPFPYVRGIFDAISGFCPELLADRETDWEATSDIHNSLEANRTYLTQVKKLVDIQSTNTLTNAFLSRLLVRDIDKDSGKDYNKKSLRIFLTRRGEYVSRIANHAEILAALESIGFIAIDTSTYSVGKLVKIFANAEVIVSECGSTALNACLFSPQSVPIVCLAPTRLIQEPDEGMIRAGLIYTLAFCERLEYYMGDTTQRSAVQSSDIVYYEAPGLLKRVHASLV